MGKSSICSNNEFLKITSSKNSLFSCCRLFFYIVLFTMLNHRFCVTARMTSEIKTLPSYSVVTDFIVIYLFEHYFLVEMPRKMHAHMHKT